VSTTADQPWTSQGRACRFGALEARAVLSFAGSLRSLLDFRQPSLVDVLLAWSAMKRFKPKPLPFLRSQTASCCSLPHRLLAKSAWQSTTWSPRRTSVCHGWSSSDEPRPAHRVKPLEAQAAERFVGSLRSLFCTRQPQRSALLPGHPALAAFRPKPKDGLQGMSAGKNEPLEGMPGPSMPLLVSAASVPLRHGETTTLTEAGVVTPMSRRVAAAPPAVPLAKDSKLTATGSPWCELPLMAPAEAETSSGSRTPTGGSRRPPGFRCRFRMASVSTKRSSGGRPMVPSLTEARLLSYGMRSRGRC
jgi:hypothetical protein